MADLKDTLIKFTFALSFQEKGKFPSQPQQNLNGQYNLSAKLIGKPRHRLSQISYDSL